MKQFVNRYYDTIRDSMYKEIGLQINQPINSKYYDDFFLVKKIDYKNEILYIING